jgi:hypothetical protein
VQRSLRYLGVDCIDLYYLHRKDAATPIEDSMRAMKVSPAPCYQWSASGQRQLLEKWHDLA